MGDGAPLPSADVISPFRATAPKICDAFLTQPTLGSRFNDPREILCSLALLMPRKSSILRKGLVLIAVPLAFQIAFAGFLLLRQKRVDEAGQWAIHTKVVIAQAETMYRTLIEADSSVRTMIAMGDQSLDAAAADALARLPRAVDALAYQVRDNPSQIERVVAMRREIDQFMAQRQALRDKARSAASPSDLMDELRDAMRWDHIQSIRARLNEFLLVEESLDRRRIGDLGRIQDQQGIILGIGVVALVGAGVLSALVFGRSIVRRIEIMNANVRRLLAGEKLVPLVAGHDEISALDASFHKMALDLESAGGKERRYQRNLERRTAELTAINHELNQKNDENEMFVYSVSHDLRSPLVNLQGFGKELALAMGEMKALLVESEVPAGIRERGLAILEHGMAEPIRFIQTAVTRLSAIIDALLRLSRAGRVEYQRSLVDVQPIVQRVVDATRSTSSEKGAQITLDPGLPQVWADPTAVEQIFANLISNALNYLDARRPGLIHVSAEPGEPDSGTVIFRVRDNGLGIPKAYLGKIFSIFQRVHGNIAPGEGIGLALVRRMAERHGGKIWVESVENEGSSFFVLLPSEPPPELGQGSENLEDQLPARDPQVDLPAQTAKARA